jgi:transposase-like protein
LLSLHFSYLDLSKKMDCSRCFSNNYVKHGTANGLPRYKCKDCNYHYTIVRRSTAKPPEVRRLALEMYLEGFGFRQIGRVLKISYVTVYYWVKKWETSVDSPVRSEPIEVVELDEMHTYIGEKKTTSGYGLLLIDMEKGISILSVGTGLRKQD